VGLRTPIPEAEKMKKAWGDRDLAKLGDTMVEVPSVGERPSRVVTYATLSDIIEPRAIELLELIQAEIGRSGCDRQLGAGVVLTGGGAKLGGLATLAEPVFSMPVRVAIPGGLETMGETLPDPAYSTVVGLAIYGYHQRLLRGAQEPSGLWGRIWNKLSH
jgi:cell division protein FtsA